jgi:hypothetical protein
MDGDLEAEYFTVRHAPCPPVGPCLKHQELCGDLCTALGSGALSPVCKVKCGLKIHEVKSTMDDYCAHCVDVTTAVKCRHSSNYCSKTCDALGSSTWWSVDKCLEKCGKNFGHVSRVFKDSCAGGLCPKD